MRNVKDKFWHPKLKWQSFRLAPCSRRINQSIDWLNQEQMWIKLGGPDIAGLANIDKAYVEDFFENHFDYSNA